MKTCCLKEAAVSLAHNRDVARCDECGSLLLAYDDERDYQSTIEELRRHRVAFETAEMGELKIVAKPRAAKR